MAVDTRHQILARRAIFGDFLNIAFFKSENLVHECAGHFNHVTIGSLGTIPVSKNKIRRLELVKPGFGLKLAFFGF